MDWAEASSTYTWPGWLTVPRISPRCYNPSETNVTPVASDLQAGLSSYSTSYTWAVTSTQHGPGQEGLVTTSESLIIVTHDDDSWWRIPYHLNWIDFFLKFMAHIWLSLIAELALCYNSFSTTFSKTQMLDVDIFIHKSQHSLSKNYKVWKVGKERTRNFGENYIFRRQFLLKWQELEREYPSNQSLPQRFLCWEY